MDDDICLAVSLNLGSRWPGGSATRTNHERAWQRCAFSQISQSSHGRPDWPSIVMTRCGTVRRSGSRLRHPCAHLPLASLDTTGLLSPMSLALLKPIGLRHQVKPSSAPLHARCYFLSCDCKAVSHRCAAHRPILRALGRMLNSVDNHQSSTARSMAAAGMHDSFPCL